jgi:hypothetical protein
MAVLLPSRAPLALGAFLARMVFLVRRRLRRCDLGQLWRNGRGCGVSLRIGRLRQRPAQALNGLPDSTGSRLPIRELLDRTDTGQAVVGFDQPGCGPIGGELRQAGFVAEAFRIRHGFGFLHCRVGHDVVGFVFDRVDDHRKRPFAVVTAVITSITPVEDTSKVILLSSAQVVKLGVQASPGRLR